jgi:hypothetical protein
MKHLTLYEKLLPEARSNLEKNEIKFEHSVGAITKTLKETYCWLNLTVLDVSRIIMFTDIQWAKITKDTFQFGVNLIDQEI